MNYCPVARNLFSRTTAQIDSNFILLLSINFNALWILYSPSHCQIIGTILPWKNFEKVKILVCIIYDSKMDKTHLQGLKNLRKIICDVLEANLDENLIFENKINKLTPKYRNFRYF